MSIGPKSSASALAANGANIREFPTGRESLDYSHGLPPAARGASRAGRARPCVRAVAAIARRFADSLPAAEQKQLRLRRRQRQGQFVIKAAIQVAQHLIFIDHQQSRPFPLNETIFLRFQRRDEHRRGEVFRQSPVAMPTPSRAPATRPTCRWPGRESAQCRWPGRDCAPDWTTARRLAFCPRRLAPAPRHRCLRAKP